MVFHRILGPAHEYLLPHQISQLLAAGTECLVHGSREVYEEHCRDPGKIALRVDARNVLNSVSQAILLSQVVAHIPQASSLTPALYGVQPSLVARLALIPSQHGTQ